jgi:hypothetical protein
MPDEYTTRNKKGQFLKGYNGLIGFKHSEESKRKTRETLKRLFEKGRLKPGIGKKFEKGHNYYPRSIEGILKIREKMRGARNPAKRPEVRIKISLKKKGSNGRIGFLHSEDTKKKMSKAHEGKKKPWAGKFITNEGRKKLSENIKGERNKLWKGGISPLYTQIRNLFEYRQWRSDILKRDDFTCQICGIRGGYLEVDHCPKTRSEIIKEYDIKSTEDALVCDRLWDINNGRTLCKPCHDKTKYGRPNKKI